MWYVIALVVAMIVVYVLSRPNSKKHATITNEKIGLKKSQSIYSDRPLQEPTPLMITPEQVKNYDDRPWRPFRWPYHQTMSIFKLDINHWLDMDKYYWRYHQEKKRIFLEYGKSNLQWLPEGYEPSMELLNMVTDHMLKRYPLLFTLKQDLGPEGGRIIYNELTEEILDMTLPLKEHPLLYCSKMAKEDWYVVLKNPKDGLHYLVAAAVPFPGGGFGIHQKIGKNLDAIHDGVVYYEEKLKKSMERWFGKLTPGDPVERASWYITWDHKLKFSNVNRLKKDSSDAALGMEDVHPKDYTIRVERQTLRKLPKSGAVVFTNHPVFYSLEEIKDEPLVPSLIRKIIYEAPEKIAQHKNFEHFRDYIAGYLDKIIQEQKEKGLINEETPIKTLPTYPFASWVRTDFDFVNGWTNPGHEKNKYDYRESVNDERLFPQD